VADGVTRVLGASVIPDPEEQVGISQRLCRHGMHAKVLHVIWLCRHREGGDPWRDEAYPALGAEQMARESFVV
jgi:hypothetical protein